MGAAGDGRGGHGHARGWAEVPITGLNGNIPTLYSEFRCVWLGHVELARADLGGASLSPSVLFAESLILSVQT